jgi:hypothetical protein
MLAAVLAESGARAAMLYICWLASNNWIHSTTGHLQLK